MQKKEHLKAEIIQEAMAKSGKAIPSQEMAKQVVRDREISIRLACRIFDISETCYCYQAKIHRINDKIADWLLFDAGL